jgi:peptide/nickel transport system substrate-binding protein
MIPLPRIILARIAATLGMALLCAAAAGAASGQPGGPRSDRLVMGLAAGPSGLDPHGYAGASDTSVTRNIYEALAHVDAHGQIQPSLAESWTVRDELVWDFALRPGVAFHDGTPFTAADVAASIARVPRLKTSLAGLAGFLQPIASLEVRGPYAVRIRTSVPAPDLLRNLVRIAILRAADGDALEPEAFNTGRLAVGTGAFRFASYTPDAAMELVRHDGWWNGASPWRAVTLRFLPRDGVRAAALLAGDVDVIERVAPNDVPVLAARPGIALSHAPALNAVYVIPAIGAAEGLRYVAAADGTPLAVNPLRDRRVRLALSLAVNRTALAERLLAGAAVPTGQFGPAGSPEQQPGIEVLPQDVARSRALLADAGFPAGLQLTLHAPSDRYASLARVAEALAQMWTRAGVATAVEGMPWNTLARRAVRGEFAAALFTCCTSSSDTLVTTNLLLVTQDAARGTGVSNHGRYANPVLDAIVEAGLQSFDPGRRAAAKRDAASIVVQDVPLILLYHPLNTWATRAPLTYEARLDGQSPVAGVSRARAPAAPTAGPNAQP